MMHLLFEGQMEGFLLMQVGEDRPPNPPFFVHIATHREPTPSTVYALCDVVVRVPAQLDTKGYQSVCEDCAQRFAAGILFPEPE